MAFSVYAHGKHSQKMKRPELSQAEVARRLGISVSYLVHLTSIGRLKARKEGHRVWYEADSFDAFAKTWKRQRAPRGSKNPRPLQQRGDIAAQAFILIDQGADWRRLVVELKIDPYLARELVREFHTTPEAESERKQAEQTAKAERRAMREHDRVQRVQKLYAHQMNLVRESKRGGVNLILPPEPGKPPPPWKPSGGGS